MITTPPDTRSRTDMRYAGAPCAALIPPDPFVLRAEAEHTLAMAEMYEELEQQPGFRTPKRDALWRQLPPAVRAVPAPKRDALLRQRPRRIGRS